MEKFFKNSLLLSLWLFAASTWVSSVAVAQKQKPQDMCWARIMAADPEAGVRLRIATSVDRQGKPFSVAVRGKNIYSFRDEREQLGGATTANATVEPLAIGTREETITDFSVLSCGFRRDLFVSGVIATITNGALFVSFPSENYSKTDEALRIDGGDYVPSAATYWPSAALRGNNAFVATSIVQKDPRTARVFVADAGQIYTLDFDPDIHPDRLTAKQLQPLKTPPFTAPIKFLRALSGKAVVVATEDGQITLLQPARSAGGQAERTRLAQIELEYFTDFAAVSYTGMDDTVTSATIELFALGKRQDSPRSQIFHWSGEGTSFKTMAHQFGEKETPVGLAAIAHPRRSSVINGGLTSLHPEREGWSTRLLATVKNERGEVSLRGYVPKNNTGTTAWIQPPWVYYDRTTDFKGLIAELERFAQNSSRSKTVPEITRIIQELRVRHFYFNQYPPIRQEAILLAEIAARRRRAIIGPRFGIGSLEPLAPFPSDDAKTLAYVLLRNTTADAIDNNFSSMPDGGNLDFEGITGALMASTGEALNSWTELMAVYGENSLEDISPEDADDDDEDDDQFGMQFALHSDDEVQLSPVSRLAFTQQRFGALAILRAARHLTVGEGRVSMFYGRFAQFVSERGIRSQPLHQSLIQFFDQPSQASAWRSWDAVELLNWLRQWDNGQ